MAVMIGDEIYVQKVECLKQHNDRRQQKRILNLVLKEVRDLRRLNCNEHSYLLLEKTISTFQPITRAKNVTTELPH